ncbi:sugar phosphate isomerase/epimerase [Verrucomicrobia bacterium]|nr:sugar phosphate isomerase/epimerase [Verrucomicrobiota bacterium]
MHIIRRRHFIASAAAAFALPQASRAKVVSQSPLFLFEKSFQNLPADEFGHVLREAGYDGIEATVRNGGRISPVEAADELPELVAALGRHQVQVGMLATNFSSVDSKHVEAVLSTAAKLGIKQYRLGHWKYKAKEGLNKQLANLRAVARDMAQMNEDLGISGLIQNHAGSSTVGAAIWDLDLILEGVSPDALGIVYDIRHAMVEGTSAWKTNWRRVQDHVRCVYVKDFVFKGKSASNVPIGEGVVGEQFYQMLADLKWSGPVCIHTPWLKELKPWDRAKAVSLLKKEANQVRDMMKTG